MINTGYSELLNAFKIHSKIPESNLLLFYTVECGLKHLFLKNNKTVKKQTIKDFDIGTHDLFDLISFCKIPRSISIKSQSRTNRNSKESIPLKEIHQAWRYGVTLKQEDEIEVVANLKNLVVYIEERI
ncbi:MAG: hypothetical protein Q8928_16745 [Bacteroidota bacterium]|nr:hypothetical protein [Bacteroidota bacterium]